MAHYTSSIEAAAELEAEYERCRLEYAALRERSTDLVEIADFRRNTLDPLMEDLRRARAHWRGIGETLAAQDPAHPQARTFTKVINNVDDDGNAVLEA